MAGLYYEDFDEFAEALYQLDGTGPLGVVLGRHGREFFRRHYTWPVIERKYLDLFERLARAPATDISPLPGFFARREAHAGAGGSPCRRRAHRACPRARR